MPVNDPKMLQELLDKIKNTPDEVILAAMDKVYKEMFEEQQMQEEVDKDENF